MAFDPTLDETLNTVLVDTNFGSIEVKLCRYNHGDSKIQINRTDRDGKWRKLGRLSLDEIPKIVAALNEMASYANTLGSVEGEREA